MKTSEGIKKCKIFQIEFKEPQISVYRTLGIAFHIILIILIFALLVIEIFWHYDEY